MSYSVTAFPAGAVTSGSRSPGNATSDLAVITMLAIAHPRTRRVSVDLRRGVRDEAARTRRLDTAATAAQRAGTTLVVLPATGIALQHTGEPVAARE